MFRNYNRLSVAQLKKTEVCSGGKRTTVNKTKLATFFCSRSLLPEQTLVEKIRREVQYHSCII